MKALLIIFYFFSCFMFVFSCGLKNEQGTNDLKQNQKRADEKTNDGYQIITAELVKKKFQNKIGAETETEEWYVRRSAADYFIKFCESDVSPQEIEKALEKVDGLIKTLTLKVDVREGEWDVCEPESIAQSRVGLYMVIKEIL